MEVNEGVLVGAIAFRLSEFGPFLVVSGVAIDLV